MPLHTSIIRDGKAIKLRWSDFHVAAMAIAATCDDPSDPEAKLFKEPTDRPSFEYPAEKQEGDGIPDEWYGKDEADYPGVPCPITRMDAFTLADYGRLALTPLNSRSVTLTREHKFVDCTDGEILHLLPGDVLNAGRM